MPKSQYILNQRRTGGDGRRREGYLKYSAHRRRSTLNPSVISSDCNSSFCSFSCFSNSSGQKNCRSTFGDWLKLLSNVPSATRTNSHILLLSFGEAACTRCTSLRSSRIRSNRLTCRGAFCMVPKLRMNLAISLVSSTAAATPPRISRPDAMSAILVS